MAHLTAIKDGFRLINRRWQLIAIQVGMMVLNCLGFFALVGIPLGIAFVVFGLDLTVLAETRDIFSILRNPADLLSKYMGLFLPVVAGFLFYVLFISSVWLFVFGGSVGVISNAILEPSSPFQMRDFFREARRLFFPLMWFTFLIGLIFIAIAFGVGIFGGFISAVVSLASTRDSTLALFLNYFFKFLQILVTIALSLMTFVVTFCGVAHLAFMREGAVRSLKAAVRFLQEKQGAFWFICLVSVVYLCAVFAIMLISYPFILIPLIGTVVSFPLQLLSGYLGLVLMAIIFQYYHAAAIIPAAEEGSISSGSSPAGDTSPPQGGGQGPLPPETAETGQGG